MYNRARRGNAVVLALGLPRANCGRQFSRSFQHCTCALLSGRTATLPPWHMQRRMHLFVCNWRYDRPGDTSGPRRHRGRARERRGRRDLRSRQAAGSGEARKQTGTSCRPCSYTGDAMIVRSVQSRSRPVRASDSVLGNGRRTRDIARVGAGFYSPTTRQDVGDMGSRTTRSVRAHCVVDPDRDQASTLRRRGSLWPERRAWLFKYDGRVE